MWLNQRSRLRRKGNASAKRVKPRQGSEQNHRQLQEGEIDIRRRSNGKRMSRPALVWTARPVCWWVGGEARLSRATPQLYDQAGLIRPNPAFPQVGAHHSKPKVVSGALVTRGPPIRGSSHVLRSRPSYQQVDPS